MTRYYQAYGYCDMHHTKHIATISTGHGDNMTPENIKQMHEALTSDLVEEFPWCAKCGMKIKVTDVTNKILAAGVKV